MPGHSNVESATPEDLGDGRSKLVMLALFPTTEARGGMLHSGMEQRMNESCAALDRLIESLD